MALAKGRDDFADPVAVEIAHREIVGNTQTGRNAAVFLTRDVPRRITEPAIAAAEDVEERLLHDERRSVRQAFQLTHATREDVGPAVPVEIHHGRAIRKKPVQPAIGEEFGRMARPAIGLVSGARTRATETLPERIFFRLPERETDTNPHP